MSAAKPQPMYGSHRRKVKEKNPRSNGKETLLSCPYCSHWHRPFSHPVSERVFPKTLCLWTTAPPPLPAHPSCTLDYKRSQGQQKQVCQSRDHQSHSRETPLAPLEISMSVKLCQNLPCLQLRELPGGGWGTHFSSCELYA